MNQGKEANAVNGDGYTVIDRIEDENNLTRIGNVTDYDRVVSQATAKLMPVA
ncbi:hypothetical protein [Rhodopirellula baltica]|uniref:hypothetical protein n=1 Tax=Rhodopirellula baltica TaxID=265606 RepID=UPI0002EEC3F7|nr:hypothetical protein [Rhodopirellula baltica]